MKDLWHRKRDVTVFRDHILVGRPTFSEEDYAYLTFNPKSGRFHCSVDGWGGCRHTEAAWTATNYGTLHNLTPPYALAGV